MVAENEHEKLAIVKVETYFEGEGTKTEAKLH